MPKLLLFRVDRVFTNAQVRRYISSHQTTGMFSTSRLTMLNDLRPRESSNIFGSCYVFFFIWSSCNLCNMCMYGSTAQMVISTTELCLFQCLRPEYHDPQHWFLHQLFSISLFSNSLQYLQFSIKCGFKIFCISWLSVLSYFPQCPHFSRH